ncbi:hypothetical protein U27_03746 [Candidatus Vecturithrix granuli]|uniref:Damage-control phosphatase ARMT1-like metal-binding domain-containing protein n=1 Tax=Vecturithrix granuli TaxID=1499967 RepID=A0A081BWS7_VECG1|nr:hypothetical protein U27_03746 [Candidatus Vecturithrix granuli]
MNALLDCVLCQQRQALRIARLVTQDSELQEQIMREAMRYLVRTHWNTDPMTITIGLYNLIERLTGNADPYKDLKYQSNQEALACYPQVQAYLRNSADPLFTACKLAAAGNIMDFGAKDEFNLQETIRHVLETDFAINHYERFTAMLAQASNILVFADNAGEIVFDKLLFETMLNRYPSLRITMVVKALPIINDATMLDVKQVGLDLLPDIEFRTINARTNGNGSSAWMPPEVKGWIKEHDMILSKGQANYEIMNALPGIFFLLIAKCPIIGHETGTYPGAYIFKQSS